MIKTFYKRNPQKKVFFFKGIKVKSYAYGKDVHNDFKQWRKHFLAKWNSPRDNFWVLECGSIDGNNAKIDRVGELRVFDSPQDKKHIVKKPSELSPLWFDSYYLEIGSFGQLIVNGNETKFDIGDEIKGWGIGTQWQGTLVRYTLFVFGKSEKGIFELSAYRIEVDAIKGLSLSKVCSTPLESTNSKKGHVYCFGHHIFVVSDSRLNYYYYNTARMALEEVAIGSDEPNAEKDFCANVSGQPVCDADGYVYWRSGNTVCFFPIGYPRRIGMVDLGESNEILGIQTFREFLFVYSRSRISRESTCFSYKIQPGGIKTEVFNRDSRYNLFYAEKNGLLHYVKIPPASYTAYSAKMNLGNESILSEIKLPSRDQMFCVNGDLYLNCSYIGAAQKDYKP